MPNIALDFGLLIAYFVPGIIALIGLAYLFKGISELKSKITSGEASAGLLIIISAFAIVVGMIISVLRAQTLDISFTWRIPTLADPIERKDPDYAKLIEEGKLNALREAENNEKRPYQFYGNTLLSVLLLIIGWWINAIRRGPHIVKQTAISLIAVVITILILYPASRRSYYRYNTAVEALNKLDEHKVSIGKKLDDQHTKRNLTKGWS